MNKNWSENKRDFLYISSRMLHNRVILLTREIDLDFTNMIIAQLLFLEIEDPYKDIYMYINYSGVSPAFTGLDIIDTMNQIRPDVSTICIGSAFGLAALLLSAGSKGKRMSLSSSEIVLRKPLDGISRGEVDIEAQAKEIVYMWDRYNNLLAEYTGQLPERINRDTEHDLNLSAVDARKYGLIDTVISTR